MPGSLRDVVFVDGVRTPFGKAGAKGLYAQTRADDMVVSCIRELLRRHPELPPERIDDVAIAATTQIGDQGLTIGRMAALLSGLPRSVPGFAVDRMCAGAMTAVTTTASGIAFGAYDVVVAGGVEHMGHHPMGEGVDPNPRIVAEKLVDPSALVMGKTAENLHDRYPEITKDVPTPSLSPARPSSRPPTPTAGSSATWCRWPSAARSSAGASRRRTSRPGRDDDGRPRHAQDAVPPARQGDGGQRRRPQRRRHRLPPRRGGHAGELGLPVRMRLVNYAFAGVDPEVMGVGPFRRPRSSWPGRGSRSTGSGCSRSTRRSPSRCWRSSITSASRTTTSGSTPTAERSPSGIRWPAAASGS